MIAIHRLAVCSALVLAACGVATRPAFPQKSEARLPDLIGGFLAKDFLADWDSLEKLPVIQWTANPPAALQNCLPDGNCFARPGVLSIEGRNLAVVAAGARTFPVSLYLRNASEPFGEEAILAALRSASFSAELARCPVPGQGGGTRWYRIRSARLDPGVLSIQTSCGSAACEGLVLSLGAELPALQANQVRLYSEDCAEGTDRRPVSDVLPHERLAGALASFIPAAGSPRPHDWTTLIGARSAVTWDGSRPRNADLSFLGDPNPLSLSGAASYAGRRYSALASGSESEVKSIYFEEGGLHAPEEDVLSALRSQGFMVQLVRCGPVYTESTNNWYRLSRVGSRDVLLRLSSRREGNRFQDSFLLRIDGSLPQRDPRDRDPGAAGCS